jgi:cytochrome c oxidase assembly factor CtaG
MCFFAEQFHIIHTLKQLYFLVLSNVFWSSVLMRKPTMNCPQFFVLSIDSRFF